MNMIYFYAANNSLLIMLVFCYYNKYLREIKLKTGKIDLSSQFQRSWVMIHCPLLGLVRAKTTWRGV